MVIKLNLDAMTERYVRSMELQVEAYRARIWSVFAAGALVGFVAGVVSVALSLP